MKIVLTLIMVLGLLLAQNRLSPLPLPKTYFIDLDIYPCDEECLKEHLNRGEIFSFLAKYRPQIADEELKKYALLYSAMLNVPLFVRDKLYIQIAGEKKVFTTAIRKVIQSLSSNLIAKNIPFEISFTQIENLNPTADLTVVFLTYEEIDKIDNITTSGTVFIPTLNKEFVPQQNGFFYGGIDYHKQLEKLIPAGENLAIFYIPTSSLSKDLTNYSQSLAKGSKIFEIKNRGRSLKSILHKNYSLNRYNILFNTPPVTTALILSQLTYYDITPPKKLSTQINYHPKIIELTQKRDRKNFYIANSITNTPPIEDAIASIYDVNLNYYWIIYSTFIGVEKLMELGNDFIEDFSNRQIDYSIRIEKASGNAFIPVEPQENREGF